MSAALRPQALLLSPTALSGFVGAAPRRLLLAPAKSKFRKHHKGRVRGVASVGKS